MAKNNNTNIKYFENNNNNNNNILYISNLIWQLQFTLQTVKPHVL